MMIKRRNGSKFLPTFSPVLFLLCCVDVSSSIDFDFGSYSRHYLGFGKLNQLLPHADNFHVATVTHHNRCKRNGAKMNSRNHFGSTAGQTGIEKMVEKSIHTAKGSAEKAKYSVDMNEIIGKHNILFVCLDTLRYDVAYQCQENNLTPHVILCGRKSVCVYACTCK